MAKDTLGETFEARSHEVTGLDEVKQLVAVKLREMRDSDGLTSDDARLVFLAARNTGDEIERAALYLRAGDLDPEDGTCILKARQAMDRAVVESVRVLVFAVYGPPVIEDNDYETLYQ